MGELADRLTAALADIETQISNAENEAASKIAALETKRAALLQAQSLVTPQAELAIVALKRIGVQI